MFWPFFPQDGIKKTNIPENLEVFQRIFNFFLWNQNFFYSMPVDSFYPRQQWYYLYQIFCIAMQALLVVLCDMQYQTASLLHRPLVWQKPADTIFGRTSDIHCLCAGASMIWYLFCQIKHGTIDYGDLFFLYICIKGLIDFWVFSQYFSSYCARC